MALQQEGREQPGVYSRNFCVRTSRLKLKIYHPNTENETTNQEPSLIRKLHQHGGEPVSQHPPKPSKKRMGEGGRGEARAPWFPSFSSSSWWSCDCGTFWGRHLGALSCVSGMARRSSPGSPPALKVPFVFEGPGFVSEDDHRAHRWIPAHQPAPGDQQKQEGRREESKKSKTELNRFSVYFS